MAWPRSVTAALTRTRRVLAVATLACVPALTIAPIIVVSGAAPAAADPARLKGTSHFKGVNWARPGDNFFDGLLVLEGLTATDDYATVKAKANAVYNGFQTNLGANTVRLPVNRKSVGTAWWNAYTGAIDAATARGFKVILSYWEDRAPFDGRIPDMAAFKTMWNTVTARYGTNDLVYFEPMNEPHGYSAADWIDIAATWIGDHPSIPRNRIFVSAIGYNDWVQPVCDDARLAGTYLSMHHYGFGSADKSYNQWAAEFKQRVGTCASRTVLDEFGAPMDDGRDYNDRKVDDNFVRYLRVDTDLVRSFGMGAVYWPALGGKHQERPTYDYYSLQMLAGSGADLVLGTCNITGVDRLRYAWNIGPGEGTAPGGLRNTGAGRCLDATGQITVRDCGAAGQTWTRTAAGEITVDTAGGRKCLDVGGQSTSDLAPVGIWDCNGGGNQKWTFYSDGTIRGVQSRRCLDVDLSTSKIIIYACWGGSNQKWTSIGIPTS